MSLRKVGKWLFCFGNSPEARIFFSWPRYISPDAVTVGQDKELIVY